MTTNEISNLEYEIEERERSMKEYWEEIKKYDPFSYSYPFNQARKINELKKNLLFLQQKTI